MALSLVAVIVKSRNPKSSRELKEPKAKIIMKLYAAVAFIVLALSLLLPHNADAKFNPCEGASRLPEPRFGGMLLTTAVTL